MFAVMFLLVSTDLSRLKACLWFVFAWFLGGRSPAVSLVFRPLSLLRFYLAFLLLLPGLLLLLLAFLLSSASASVISE